MRFDRPFDAVFSNAALHWMTRATKVIAGVHRALRPGGRFVGEFGGFGNVAAVVTALIAVLDRRGQDGAAAKPWYNPTAEEYAALLEAQGMRVEIRLIPARRRCPPVWLAGSRLSTRSSVVCRRAGALPRSTRTCSHPRCGTPRDGGPLTTCAYDSPRGGRVAGAGVGL
jgi:SAM-dependent methyltransferase